MFNTIYNWRTNRYESRYTIPKAKRAMKRAALGAAFMDKVRKGWFWDVRVTRLDMSSSCNCILGQVEGGYGEGTDKYNLEGEGSVTDSKAERLGFITHDKFKVDYALLDQAWANEVRKRRGFKPVNLTSPADGRLLVTV